MRKYIHKEIEAFVNNLEEALLVFEENGKLYEEAVVIDFIEAMNQLYLYLKKTDLLDNAVEFDIILNETDKMIDGICEQKISIGEFYESLKWILLKVNQVLKSSLITYEMVFLPYKAAMWDSMESVWREACSDKNCNCTVAVLPYYTKKKNGSMGERISEKDKFPDYVSVIEADNYDFERNHPDVIIIHNPYDEYNKITTVDPRYYSSELKKYTNKLVYIPYFVAVKEVIENFCILPVLRNADLVVLQSEEIAEAYKENYVWGNKDKFVGWGSPKFDMLKKEGKSVVVKKEWCEKIGNRKVFLYNTHLNPLLREPEETLKKIRHVLKIFAEKKDIVLLWRPHPLSISTLGRVSEKAKKEYLDLIEEYKKSGNGIYDDSSDLSGAISAADAYIGDPSSLVLLFQKIGKPVFIQNAGDILENSAMEERNACFEDACFEGGGIWFSDSTYNGLYYYDSESKNVEFKGIFPGESIDCIRLFRRAFLCENRLVFIPFNAKQLFEYDLVNKKFFGIDMKLCKGEETGSWYNTAIMNGKKIYCLPFYSKEIICYDSGSHTVKKMTKWNRVLDKYIDLDDKICFVNAAEDGDIIVAPFYQRNMLFLFHMKTEEIETVTVGEKTDGGFSNIEIVGDIYYLFLSGEQQIIKYNKITGKYSVIEYDIVDFPKECYFDSVKFKNSIIFLENMTGRMFSLDLRNDKVEQICKLADDLALEKLYAGQLLPYTNIKKMEPDRAVIFPMGAGNLLTVNEKEELFSYPIPISKKNTLERINTVLNERNCEIFEKNYSTIEDYISYVLEKNAENENCNYDSCGKVIYKNLLM